MSALGPLVLCMLWLQGFVQYNGTYLVMRRTRISFCRTLYLFKVFSPCRHHPVTTFLLAHQQTRITTTTRCGAFYSPAPLAINWPTTRSQSTDLRRQSGIRCFCSWPAENSNSISTCVEFRPASPCHASVVLWYCTAVPTWPYTPRPLLSDSSGHGTYHSTFRTLLAHHCTSLASRLHRFDVDRGLICPSSLAGADMAAHPTFSLSC